MANAPTWLIFTPPAAWCNKKNYFTPSAACKELSLTPSNQTSLSNSFRTMKIFTPGFTPKFILWVSEFIFENLWIFNTFCLKFYADLNESNASLNFRTDIITCKVVTVIHVRKLKMLQTCYMHVTLDTMILNACKLKK